MAEGVPGVVTADYLLTASKWAAGLRGGVNPSWSARGGGIVAFARLLVGDTPITPETVWTDLAEPGGPLFPKPIGVVSILPKASFKGVGLLFLPQNSVGEDEEFAWRIIVPIAPQVVTGWAVTLNTDPVLLACAGRFSSPRRMEEWNDSVSFKPRFQVNIGAGRTSRGLPGSAYPCGDLARAFGACLGGGVGGFLAPEDGRNDLFLRVSEEEVTPGPDTSADEYGSLRFPPAVIGPRLRILDVVQMAPGRVRVRFRQVSPVQRDDGLVTIHHRRFSNPPLTLRSWCVQPARPLVGKNPVYLGGLFAAPLVWQEPGEQADIDPTFELRLY